MHDVSVDPNILDLLIAFLDQEQLAADALRAKIGRLRNSPRIAIDVWWQLLEDVQLLCPIDALGLHIGQCLEPHHAGVLGYLGIYSDTIGQAIMRFHRYQPLLHTLVPTTLRAEAGHIILGWQADRRSTALSDDVLSAGIMRFLTLLTGRNDVRPSLIKTRQAAVANGRLHERFFGCPVLFNANVTEIHFPATLANLPINSKDPYLFSLLERQADAMLQALPKQDPLLSDVQQAILAIMQDATPTMAQVAKHIGMAERSLYRELAARGTGFKALVSALRFELAKDYLRDNDLKLPDISLLLGFADQSVFTRAFRQWSGVSPLQWRKQALRAG